MEKNQKELKKNKKELKDKVKELETNKKELENKDLLLKKSVQKFLEMGISKTEIAQILNIDIEQVDKFI